MVIILIHSAKAYFPYLKVFFARACMFVCVFGSPMCAREVSQVLHNQILVFFQCLEQLHLFY